MAAVADAHAHAPAAHMPFIKNLASSDRRLRTQSLAALQAFLASRTVLAPADARMLWTGLFYALWMTDRPRPQQALADALAALLLDLRPACAEPWLRAFWAVLSTQWPRIDALRLNKFLLLVRRVFAAHVRWAALDRYASDRVRPVADLLRSAALDVAENHGVALGLRLHLLDIWVDELERAGALAPAADATLDAARARFVATVAAMVHALRTSPVKSVRERASESCQDSRLPSGPTAGQEAADGAAGCDGHDESWDGIED